MTADTMSTAQMERITDHLDNWENIGFDDRRIVADGLLARVKATSEHIQIEWKL